MPTYDRDNGLAAKVSARDSERPHGSSAILGEFAIDRDAEIPIGVQLAWLLRARIGSGQLRSGQRLPGLRDLADDLDINANTVRTVYQRLEREGLIASRQGTGTFVANVNAEHAAIEEIALDATLQARAARVDPREVAATLYVTATHEQAKAGAPQADAARRRELRRQIAALEGALVELQAQHPSLIPSPSQAARDAAPRLLTIDELERTRTEIVGRLAAAAPLLESSADSDGQGLRERASAAGKGSSAAKGATAASAKRVKSTKTRKPASARATPRPSTA